MQLGSFLGGELVVDHDDFDLSAFGQVNAKDSNLRKQVLQGVSDDGEEPDLSRSDAYQDARLRAETFVGVIGINNLYAAYFLGKTELAGE